jgi:glycosyltransferase involved in cell wall biosynthesis
VEGAPEVLVVEDGTEEVDERGLAAARLIRLPRVGRSRARNAGVEAAAGRYVAFLDADDVSLPDRLERQREALEAEPEAALCYGAVRVVDGELETLGDWNALLERRFAQLVGGGSSGEAILASRCPIYTSATMVRRVAFLEAGGYDARFDAYEDLDLYLRLASCARLVPCPGGPVTLYRVHGENTASDRLYAGALGVAEKHLPAARGRSRRLLFERRVDALWGLGRFGQARRAAAAALLREPLLLADHRFVKRAAGSLLPARLLRARRR